MSKKFEQYRNLEFSIPDYTWAWNMYGAGTENIGRDGMPEQFPVPEIGNNQMLVRVDSVGMCYSDVKLINQGGKHPKLYNRDLASKPTRLGHEAALTVIKVGKHLQDDYYPGQRLAIQPDIYQDGISSAYGYTIPGGLTQYHLIGPEVLEADDGAYVLSVDDDLGYAETALTEPWACVAAAYTQRRRLSPKQGGWMWIIGNPGDSREYKFSSGLDAPEVIVLTDSPPSLENLIKAQHSQAKRIIMRDGLTPNHYAAFVKEMTVNRGFDDIVVLNPHTADQVTEAAKHIAFRGTFNMIGQQPLEGKSELDVGRIHYHYTAYVGNSGPDIAASYGNDRNRCDLFSRGTAIFLGAGGPMGQMHIQRAIEMPDGPTLIIATEVNKERLAVLEQRFSSMASRNGKRLLAFDPSNADQSLLEIVLQETEEQGADDVVVCVPVASLIEEAAQLLAPNGMLVLFAGVSNGTFVPIDISSVYLNNMQLTGTSGSRLADQKSIIDKVLARESSPNRSVAAVGGIEAALDAIEAMMSGKYAGKVVIFPQLSGLPLMSLDELVEKYPDVAELFGEDRIWTSEVEQTLIEIFWRGNDDKQETDS